MTPFGASDYSEIKVRCGLVPRNALVLTEPINSETIVREHLVVWLTSSVRLPRNGVRGDDRRFPRSRLLGTNLAVAGPDYFRLADKLPKRWVRL